MGGLECFELDYTGSGYFLSVRSAELPETRIVLDNPVVMGEADGVTCGFLAFVENGGLILECHSWGELDVPEDSRDRDVKITTRLL